MLTEPGHERIQPAHKIDLRRVALDGARPDQPLVAVGDGMKITGEGAGRGHGEGLPGHRIEGNLSHRRMGIRENQIGAGAPCQGTALKASSTGTCKPVTRRFVSEAMPITAISSKSCASVMPLARAAVVWERMQYSQPLATETAT